MKYRWLVGLFALLVAAEFVFVLIVFRRIPDTRLDIQAAYEIRDAYAAQWEQLMMGEYPEFPNNPKKLDYSVYSEDKGWICATRRALQHSNQNHIMDIRTTDPIEEGITNWDAIIDIAVNDKKVGEIVFYNPQTDMIIHNKNVARVWAVCILLATLAVAAAAAGYIRWSQKKYYWP